MSVCLSICLSVCLSIFLSASLKTKLFCETSSVFELDNIKNAAIQRDFLNFCTWQRQKRSNSARRPHFLSWQHQKTKWCRVIRSAAPVTQNHLSKPEDLMLQNATPISKWHAPQVKVKISQAFPMNVVIVDNAIEVSRERPSFGRFVQNSREPLKLRQAKVPKSTLTGFCGKNPQEAGVTSCGERIPPHYSAPAVTDFRHVLDKVSSGRGLGLVV